MNANVRLTVSHIDQREVAGTVIEEYGVELKMVARDSRSIDFEVTTKSQDRV